MGDSCNDEGRFNLYAPGELQPGDTVLVRPDLTVQTITDNIRFVHGMLDYCGRVVTIKGVTTRDWVDCRLKTGEAVFELVEDSSNYVWHRKWFMKLETFEVASEDELNSYLFG